MVRKQLLFMFKRSANIMKLGYRNVAVVVLLMVLNASASHAQQQFTHTVTRLNKNCNATCTVLDVPELNNNPIAIILVTPVVENGVNLNPHPIGAYFMYLKKWSIYNLDQTAIAEGAKFKVQYFLNPGPDRFVYTVPQRVRESDVPYIDHAGLNDNPDAQIRFFPTGSLTRGALYNKDDIKVEYDATVHKWHIANINNRPVMAEVAYNIVIDSRGSSTAPISAETKDSSTDTSDAARMIEAIDVLTQQEIAKIHLTEKATEKLRKLQDLLKTLNGQLAKLNALQQMISELEQIMQQLEREEQKGIWELKEQKIKAIQQANESIKQRSSGFNKAPDTTAIEWFRFIREYEANEVAANAKYTGKRIRVTGSFERAEIEKGQILVWFTAPAATVSHCGCYFQDSQRAAVAALKSGETIVVEGTFDGLKHKGAVTLENCVLR